jgi:hypothetical protein
MTEQTTGEQTTTEQPTWTQEFEVESEKLLENVKGILRQGNARRIIIRKHNDDVLLDLPLPIGVGAAVLAVYLTPFIAVITAVVGVAVRLKVQVVRRGAADGN